MALLTKKSIYGLIAIYELYKQKDSSSPMQLKTISDNTNISKNYLEQIFIELKKANLVNSIRGSKGGYQIANSENEILIKDVILALDGNISTTKDNIENSVFAMFFDDCNQKLLEIFNKPISIIEEYELMLTRQLNYSI